MPVVARIGGVKIVLFTNDHPPPHFHAMYGEHHATVDIRENRITAGRLPPKQHREVLAWAASRKDVLIDAFQRARANLKIGDIG